MYSRAISVKSSQIDHHIGIIRKSFKTEKDHDDFIIYLSRYQEKCELANKIKMTEKDVLRIFERNHSIFYNKTSQLYYNYVGDNFISMNEDNLLYLVLEFISNNVPLIDINQKNTFKNKIIKQIKENNIYESIPDSKTIQATLSLLNETFFHEKAYSKCFLITIGRIILQKKAENSSLIFSRVNMKGFLNELNKKISIYFCNTNLFNFFKFKFTQDHQQSNFRKYVIPCTKINSCNIKIDDQEYINMIIVAIYYYNRYNTIDNYLESENITHQIKDNIQYLDIDRDNIISKFTQEHIIREAKQYMHQKQLIFLWKKYTYEKDIFVNSFTSYSDFVCELFNTLNVVYDKESNNNLLVGYYSLDLPHVDDFKQFWNDNFYDCPDENNLELNEILHLYNRYGKIKKHNLSETLIKIILQCFYMKHEVIENKLINCVGCKLWDKQKEIKTFIDQYDINVEDNLNGIYKKYVSTTKSDCRISKIYFQNYILEKVTTNHS